MNMKCPDCGTLFEVDKLIKGLIPTHDYPKPCRVVCPGSKHSPRSTADGRPLWKDERK